VTKHLDVSAVTILAPTHKVGAFACGGPEQDEFLRNRASDEQSRGLCQIYVSVDSANQVVAYFTLSPITVPIASGLLEKLGLTQISYQRIGGYLLGQLGVHENIAGKGIGSALVMRAAEIARNESKVVGGAFLAVDPQDEELIAWYEKLGFVRLSADKRRMILPFQRVP
jgi:GNAT superfamily N-acetyltransferase